MAETSLASAVALPEQDSNSLPPASPEAGIKRRRSSITDSDGKRRRLSSQVDSRDRDSSNGQVEAKGASPSAERNGTRQTSHSGSGNGGRDEERKRGQRLFGALLGTLSQNSSTAAQRRRADIEKRQQAKLRMQDEEYDELKKKRRQEMLAMRKKEQKFFERESMHTRHTNMLAMAHFLKTKTEPVLYYKPWQLRPEHERIIREQIEEAETTIAQERAGFDARYPPGEFSREAQSQSETQPEEKREPVPEPENEQHLNGKEPRQDAGPVSGSRESRDMAHEASDAVGAEDTNHEKPAEVAKTDTASTTNDTNAAVDDQADIHRAAEDDGGEVVEDKEDTVIY